MDAGTAFDLLQVKEVQNVGLILLGFAIFMSLIVTEKIFLPGAMAAVKSELGACTKERDDLRVALAAANATNKQCERDYAEARITAARFEERATLRWTPPRSERET